MLLLNEFLIYLVKFIALGIIAYLGILCGIKYKKNKLSKTSSEKKDVK